MRIQLKPGTVTNEEKFNYCLKFWNLNHDRMKMFEVPYYQGRDKDKSPHGIENAIWKKAYEKWALDFIGRY